MLSCEEGSEIAPRIRHRTDQPQFLRLRRGGRRVKVHNQKFSELCELGGHEKKSIHASRTSARTGCVIGNSSTQPFVLSLVEGRRRFFLKTGVSVVKLLHRKGRIAAAKRLVD
jgi:hypothetical protein